ATGDGKDRDAENYDRLVVADGNPPRVRQQLVERHGPEVLELIPKLLDDCRKLAGLQSTDDKHSQPAEDEQQQSQAGKQQAGFDDALLKNHAVHRTPVSVWTSLNSCSE